MEQFPLKLVRSFDTIKQINKPVLLHRILFWTFFLNQVVLFCNEKELENWIEFAHE